MKPLSFLKNQVVPRRVCPRTIPMGLYRGVRMEINPRHQSQLFFGLQEVETHSWMRRLCKGISMAIDIGAAGGEQTLYLLLKTGAKKVYAIEPDAEQRKVLERNVALNGDAVRSKLEIIPKFVGKQNDVKHFSLDSMLGRVNYPCFIKMDIDGDEVEALMGARELLKTMATRWLVETHSCQLERECVKIFSSEGYNTKIIYNAWWRFFIPEQRLTEINRWLVAYKAE